MPLLSCPGWERTYDLRLCLCLGHLDFETGVMIMSLWRILRKTYSHHRFARGDTNLRRRKPLAMTLATGKRVYSSDRLLLMRNLRETTQLSLRRCPRKLLFVRLRIGLVPDMGSINLLVYHLNCLLQLNSRYMSSILRISHAVKRQW